MEKLQPILQHKFWILFAVAIVLPPIGWWSATGALKSEIETRREKLDSTLSSIPTGQNAPNQSWIDEITKRNQAQERINLETAMRLWAAQRPLRVWPADVAEVMKQFDDRPTEEEIAKLTGRALSVPDLYAQDYERELRRIWEIVDPFDVTRTGGTMTTSSAGLGGAQPSIDLRRDSNAKRKVVFPFEAIPKVPSEKWKAGLPPSFEEIWDAQEDIWLLTEILEAIRRLNRNANNIAEAHVRRIDQIRLFGGKWSEGEQGGATGGPGESSDMAAEYAAISGSATGGLPGQKRQITADIDLNQWFTELNELGGGAGTNPLATMAMSSAASGSEMPAAGTVEKRRYIDDEDLPYRTRGFYLKVVMDHRQLPDFQAELLKSRWPLQFVAIQQVAFNLNRLGSSGPTAGGAAGLLTTAEGSASPALSTPTGTFGPSRLGSSGIGRSPGALGIRRPGQPVIIPPEVGLADASLATVVIVGTLRIYKKPEIPAEAQPSEGAAEPQPPATAGSAAPPTTPPATPANAQPTAPQPTTPASSAAGDTSPPAAGGAAAGANGNGAPAVPTLPGTVPPPTFDANGGATPPAPTAPPPGSQPTQQGSTVPADSTGASPGTPQQTPGPGTATGASGSGAPAQPGGQAPQSGGSGKQP